MNFMSSLLLLLLFLTMDGSVTGRPLNNNQRNGERGEIENSQDGEMKTEMGQKIERNVGQLPDQVKGNPTDPKELKRREINGGGVVKKEEERNGLEENIMQGRVNNEMGQKIERNVGQVSDQVKGNPTDPEELKIRQSAKFEETVESGENNRLGELEKRLYTESQTNTAEISDQVEDAEELMERAMKEDEAAKKEEEPTPGNLVNLKPSKKPLQAHRSYGRKVKTFLVRFRNNGKSDKIHVDLKTAEYMDPGNIEGEDEDDDGAALYYEDETIINMESDLETMFRYEKNMGKGSLMKIDYY